MTLSPPLSLQGEGQGGGKRTRFEKGGVNRGSSKKIRTNAKRLRQNLTEVEKALWYHLRAQRFAGYKFRRQHPIGPYIVDFVCLGEKLIIELDGGHYAENNKDEVCTAYLQSQGFTVLRFWNNDVMENMEGVLEMLAKHLTPTSVLPLKGEEYEKIPSPFRERARERVLL